jgi:hypothetical protein
MVFKIKVELQQKKMVFNIHLDFKDENNKKKFF